MRLLKKGAPRNVRVSESCFLYCFRSSCISVVLKKLRSGGHYLYFRNFGIEMGEEDMFPKKITIGVCVMEKKAISAPMLQILERLQAFGEFEIVHFGDKVILEEPIESWPICDCLIAFYSTGYPLKRAEAYAALRKCICERLLDKVFLLEKRALCP